MSILEELKRRNVIRVAVGYIAVAWLVIQVVETLFPIFALPDSVARMIIIVLGIGFFPSLALSWLFELTPEGIKREADLDRSKSIGKDTNRVFDRVVMVLLALAVAYFMVDKFILSETRLETAREEGRSEALVASYGEKSIAVLPFADMSAAGDQEYMSDGIAEELLNLLSKVPEMRVISRSSAFAFKGKDIDIPTIAEELNVQHVLEGSVRKAGNQVRIAVQLIDARSDTQLWSETFDRVLDDIFAIQDEIAQAVVSELKLTLLGDAPSSTETSAEAYDQYLLGQHLLHQRTKESIEAAAEHFQNAIAKDPEYAPAHAAYAIASMLLMDASNTYGDLSLDEAAKRAFPAAENALQLDSGLAEAYAALGLVSYQQQNLETSLRHWDRAVELNPNYALVYSWRGTLLGQLGRYEQAFSSTSAAVSLDPLSINVLNNYSIGLFQRGRSAESAQVLERMKAISPPAYHYLRSWQAYQKGEPADALFALLDGYEINPDDRRIPQGFANMFGLMGIHEEAVRHSARSIRWLPYRWNADFKQLLEIAREDFNANPDNRFLKAQLGIALLAARDVDAAMPLLDGYVRSFEDGVGPQVLIAGAVALHRQVDGDTQGAAAILDVLKVANEQSKAGGIEDNPVRSRRAVIALLEGRQDDALDAINDLSRGSGLEPHMVAALRALTDIDSRPMFEGILVDQASRWAEQREWALARICGDNDWSEWKPLPGTCNN